jgi:DNA-directed RNA polymerase subunit E'/Rpb7
MGPMFDAAATAGALGEVVDSNTLESFQRHWRGKDSKQQIESAKKVRAQVEAQRAKVRADRLKIERLTGKKP